MIVLSMLVLAVLAVDRVVVIVAIRPMILAMFSGAFAAMIMAARFAVNMTMVVTCVIVSPTALRLAGLFVFL